MFFLKVWGNCYSLERTGVGAMGRFDNEAGVPAGRKVRLVSTTSSGRVTGLCEVLIYWHNRGD